MQHAATGTGLIRKDKLAFLIRYGFNCLELSVCLRWINPLKTRSEAGKMLVFLSIPVKVETVHNKIKLLCSRDKFRGKETCLYIFLVRYLWFFSLVLNNKKNFIVTVTLLKFWNIPYTLKPHRHACRNIFFAVCFSNCNQCLLDYFHCLSGSLLKPFLVCKLTHFSFIISSRRSCAQYHRFKAVLLIPDPAFQIIPVERRITLTGLHNWLF
jgi:hypothetical protein